MYELELENNFDRKYLQHHRNQNLADIIKRCESSISGKVRKTNNASNDDKTIFDNLLKNFLCAYSSIEEKVQNEQILKNEPAETRCNINRQYSLYSASKAILNQLLDSHVDNIRSYENNYNFTNIVPSDINQDTDIALLLNLLPKLEDVKSSKDVNHLRYEHFKFFERINCLSKRYISTECSQDTKNKLSQTEIKKEGLNFNPIPKPKKSEFSSEQSKAQINSEELPANIPEYTPNANAKLEKVIGNEDLIEKIQGACIRVAMYDSQRKSNPFITAGFDFDDTFIIGGKPGTGKNYTVDAIANYILETAPKYNENIMIADLSSGIKSSYLDKKSMLFENYIKMINKGEKAYICIFDEADTVFTIDGKGKMHEESKKLLGEMKKAINSTNLGNAVYIFLTNYPGQFEGALKNRFTHVIAEGPTKPEHFSKSLKQEMGYAGRNLDNNEFQELGQLLHKYQEDYDTKYERPSIQDLFQTKKSIPVTYRNVKKIALPFIGGDNRKLIANEYKIRSSSYEQQERLIPQLVEPASKEQVKEYINTHMKNLVKSEKDYA